MNFGVPEYDGIFSLISFSCDKPKTNAAIPATRNMNVEIWSNDAVCPRLATPMPYAEIVNVRPAPNNNAIKRPFLYP